MTRIPLPAGGPALLPQQVGAVWREVAEGRRTTESAMAEQERLIGEHRRRWHDALVEAGQPSLEASLLRELGDYVGMTDLDALRARCRRAADLLNAEWRRTVDRREPDSVRGYYRRVDGTVYELLWWHTLVDEESPLAYVNALELALARPGRRYLDFGSGVGSGGLLFARAGFDVTLADISLPLLAFCRWRVARRRLPARYIDTTIETLPAESFDVITAMDVFEHLVDPEATAADLVRALAPEGILVARLAAEEDPDRPSTSSRISLRCSGVSRRSAAAGSGRTTGSGDTWRFRSRSVPPAVIPLRFVLAPT